MDKYCQAKSKPLNVARCELLAVLSEVTKVNEVQKSVLHLKTVMNK